MKGFTLIELVIVVMILIILVSIGAPLLMDKSAEIYNPVEKACPAGLTTAITPSGEEVLVCRKEQSKIVTSLEIEG